MAADPLHLELTVQSLQDTVSSVLIHLEAVETLLREQNMHSKKGTASTSKSPSIQCPVDLEEDPVSPRFPNYTPPSFPQQPPLPPTIPQVLQLPYPPEQPNYPPSLSYPFNPPKQPQPYPPLSPAYPPQWPQSYPSTWQQVPPQHPVRPAGQPPRCEAVKAAKRNVHVEVLSSSAIVRESLVDPDVVVRKYCNYRSQSKVPTLA